MNEDIIIRCKRCGKTRTFAMPWDAVWRLIHSDEPYWFCWRIDFSVHAPGSYQYLCAECHSASWAGGEEGMGR